MGDFLAFRRMITPVIIQVLFWAGVLACVILGVETIFVSGGEARSALLGWGLLLVGPFVVRLFCEAMILFFRMNETLTEIREELRRQVVSPRRPAESAEALLAELRLRGAEFTVVGDRLRYQEPPGGLTPDEVEQLRHYKSEILALLRNQTSPDQA